MIKFITGQDRNRIIAAACQRLISALGWRSKPSKRSRRLDYTVEAGTESAGKEALR
jgi:hypothetical protein